MYLHNSDANGHSHFLHSAAKLELLERHLFIDASASSGTQNLSLTGAQGTPNVNITGNTADVRRVSVSPHWVSNVGQWGVVNARYTLDELNSSGAGAALDSTLHGFEFGVSSGRAFSRWQWGLNHRTQRTEYSNASLGDRETESTLARMSYAIDPTLRATVTRGYNSSNFRTTAFQNSGASWTVGLSWRPSPRTSVSGDVGRRNYGQTRQLNVSHRHARWTFSGGYNDQVVETPLRFGVPATSDTAATLDSLLLGRFPDPQERAQAVQEFIAQNGLPTSLESPLDFATGQVYTSKRLHFGAGFSGRRYTMLGNVFVDRRVNAGAGVLLPGDAFALGNDVDQTGYSVLGTYQLAPATSATMSFSQVRSTYSSNAIEDTTTRLIAGVTHRFHPRLSGRFDVRLSERDSNANTSYREHAVVGSVQVRF